MDQDKQLMRASQISAKQAREGGTQAGEGGAAPKKSGYLPRAGNAIKHPFQTGKKAGSWMKKTFWTGKEGAEGTNQADNVRENAQEYIDGKYNSEEEAQGTTEARGPIRIRQGENASEGEPINEFIIAYVDAGTRGHSRSAEDKTSKIFDYVTDEYCIKNLDGAPAEAEGYNRYYVDDMNDVRYGNASKGMPGLASKLINKDIKELSYAELDILFTTMLNDTSKGGRELFFEFLEDVAKINRDPNQIGNFKANVILRLATTRSTDELVEKEIPPNSGLGTIMDPSIAQEYFEENSYPIIEEVVKEFENRLPENVASYTYIFNPNDLSDEDRAGYESLDDEAKEKYSQSAEKQIRDTLNNTTKRRLVDSFRQILLSDPLVIEDVEEFGKKMPATYKKDVADKVKEIIALIDGIGEFKGSEVREERLNKRLEKLKDEVSKMDDIDENIRKTLTTKLEELEKLYEKKKQKVENVKKVSTKVSSITRELNEDDKKKIEEFNLARVELEEVDSDITLLGTEVNTETKQDDEAIKIAKDVIKKLKESVTEDGITKDQYIIEAIIYEGGLKQIDKILKGVAVLDKPAFNGLVELTHKLAGIMVLEPATRRNVEEIEMEDETVLKGLKKIQCLIKNITFYALSPSVLKAWASKGGVFKKALYYGLWPIQTTLAGIYGLGCLIGYAAKGIVWDSYSNRGVKRWWFLRPFGIGTAKAIHELRENRDYMIKKKGKNFARKGYLAYGLMAWAFAGITTMILLPSKTYRESMPSFGYPNFKSWPVSIGKWYVDVNASAFTVHEKHPESKRKKTKISVLGDVNTIKEKAKKGKKVKVKDVQNIEEEGYLNATKDMKFMLQVYYPGMTQSEITEKGHLKALKEKEKEHKEQLEWLQEHQEVADFLAERRFAVKLIDYARNGEQMGKDSIESYDVDGNIVMDFAKKTKEYKKMGLKLNPNKTPDFIAELMAIEQGIELVNSDVNKELKPLHEDSGTYREMVEKHGEHKVINSIDGHIIGIITNAMSIDKKEAKNARKELAGYGIGFDEEGKLQVNNNEKLRTAVVENVVKKIEEYGIEYFNEEMKVSKAEINHKYLYNNVRNWEEKEYILPKQILGYMNTYGITSVENAEFLMANPDVVEWLGNAITRGHAVLYIPDENVEKVVDMFRENAKKATDGVGVVTILSDKKRFTIKADIENKALEQELAIDTADEYRIHKENERIILELGDELYPNSQELINYLRNNEVKNDWFEHLYGEETYRDETEIKSELVAYLEGQKKELASTRAKRIEEDIRYIEQEIKEVQAEYDLLAETEGEKNALGSRLIELDQKKENLEQEKEDPEAYLNGIINYIKHGVKEEETEGFMTEEAQVLLAMERETRRTQALEYLENARKEKDIKHMLSTYRDDTAAVMVIDGQLDDFIRYVMKHIENGGRASDFDAYGKSEMNRRYLEHAKKEGYIKSSLAEVSTVDESGVEVKVKIDMKALDMCEPITMNFNNVFEHMKDEKEYQKALEKEGEDGLKNAARAFIYKKMEQALENNKVKNELIANGVRFNGKTRKAEIADAEKLANYIYEGKIKEIGQTSGISEELILNSQGLFKEIDEMISKNAKHVAKKKKYGEEQVLDAVHGYLLAQLAMVQGGDVAMQNKLEENGIEFNEDGVPGMTDEKKANKYLMSEILKDMKKFGIENIENRTEQMKQGLEVTPGETMGEDKMDTPEESKTEYDLLDQGLDYSNGVTTLKDDKGIIWVKFTEKGEEYPIYLMPRDATEKIKADERVLEVKKGPMLVNMEGKPAYKFTVLYDKKWSTEEVKKVKYVDMKGEVTPKE